MSADAAVAHRRIDQIDSLRCLAMTAVVAQHCLLLPFGWVGVWLFFVISGFVVTTSLLARDEEGSAPGRLGHFYVRRAARIFPIYMLYAVIGAFWSAAQAGAFEWRPFLSLLFFYNDFETVFGQAYYTHFPSGHLWTVSIEMQFYLFYGLAFVLLPRRSLVWVLGSFLVLCPLMRFLAGLWLLKQGLAPLDAAFAIYTASVLHFDSFGLGALLALGSRTWLDPRKARRLVLAGLAVLGLYVATYAAVNAAGLGQVGLSSLRNIVSGILIGQHREVFVYSALALLSAGVIALTASGRAPWAAITANPLLQAIGRASYGGYVYHLLWVTGAVALIGAVTGVADQKAFSLPQKLLTFVIAYPLTVAMSHLSFVYFERPIIARAAQWLKGRRVARTPAAMPEFAKD